MHAGHALHAKHLNQFSDINFASALFSFVLLLVILHFIVSDKNILKQAVHPACHPVACM